MRRLERVDFSLTKEWLAPVKEWKEVTKFDFFGSDLGDAELTELKGLNNVPSMGFSRTKGTDAGLKELKEGKKLTSLDASETALTPAGIKERTELQSVDLSSSQRRDSDLKEIKALQPWRDLDGRGTHR
jgi:internalin A